jgi:hypothetical protein
VSACRGMLRDGSRLCTPRSAARSWRPAGISGARSTFPSTKGPAPPCALRPSPPPSRWPAFPTPCAARAARPLRGIRPDIQDGMLLIVMAIGGAVVFYATTIPMTRL